VSAVVTQADREAAAGSIADDGSHGAYMLIDCIMRGRMDDSAIVQAFAAHREAHTAGLVAALALFVRVGERATAYG
jgi:hypothetical protein